MEKCTKSLNRECFSQMFVGDSALEGMNPKRNGGMKSGQIERLTDK